MQSALNLQERSLRRSGQRKVRDPLDAVCVHPLTATADACRGFFDLVVKVYPKGNISKVLGDMKEGDTIEAKGPIPKLDYQPNKWKKFGMIAGAPALASTGCTRLQ
jgi:cytochrome-b5 reductase